MRLGGLPGRLGLAGEAWWQLGRLGWLGADWGCWGWGAVDRASWPCFGTVGERARLLGAARRSFHQWRARNGCVQSEDALQGRFRSKVRKTQWWATSGPEWGDRSMSCCPEWGDTPAARPNSRRLECGGTLQRATVGFKSAKN